MRKVNNSYLILVALMLISCETKENGYEYIDLALPSGNLWATYNVGSHSVIDGGDYFTWGETQPSVWDGSIVGDKYSADWSSYKYYTPKFGQTKYCLDKHSKYYDELFVLESCDDAATVNMGGKWITPCLSDYIELRTECQVYSVRNFNSSGVPGEIYVSKKNGKSLFLPEGCLWTSELELDLYNFYGFDGKKVQERNFEGALTSCGIGLYRCQTLHIRGIIPGKKRSEVVMDSLDNRLIEMINEGDTSMCDIRHKDSCIP